MDDFAPLQQPYTGSRATFHSLLIGRIYHEDALFAQRSYILLGVHAFLLTAFTVLIAGRDSRLVWLVAGSLSIFGSLLGIFQASFGRQTARAIGFWREYVRLVEEKWQIGFDHLQYDFYTNAVAETSFGVIVKRRERQKPLYQSYRHLRFLTSITTVTGLLFPIALGSFWALNLGLVLKHLTQRYWVGALGFSLLLAAEAFVLLPSLAEATSAVSANVARSD